MWWAQTSWLDKPAIMTICHKVVKEMNIVVNHSTIVFKTGYIHIAWWNLRLKMTHAYWVEHADIYNLLRVFIRIFTASYRWATQGTPIAPISFRLHAYVIQVTRIRMAFYILKCHRNLDLTTGVDIIWTETIVDLSAFPIGGYCVFGFFFVCRSVCP